MKNLILLISLTISTSLWGQSEVISLESDKLSNGEWQYLYLDPQEDVKLPDLNDSHWNAISVPGDINTQLMKDGILPDLQFDTLGRTAYWVSAKEWWYMLRFDADFQKAEKTELVLDFVDGNAEIWLNNKKLGEMENAFYPHRFEVSDALKTKNNVLLVRFASINDLLGGKRLDPLRGWGERRAFIRKPQFNFGWDWALPIPGLGLAGDVYIENGNLYHFTENGIYTTKEGRVDMNFEVSKPAKVAGYNIVISIEGHGTEIHDTIKREENIAYKSYRYYNITNPKLWFPNGYGTPNLYQYEIKLLVDGKVRDQKKGKFGIREIKIRENPFTEKAGIGYAFEILVNDQPIFVKGSNWIPTEIWPGSIKPEKYRFYLEKAAEANFNMLRVWGGGMYEQDLFYEICDELGIMVWQDFMFAGAGYPVDSLMDEIIKEAKYQIYRLRNHPSIVIWCGTNEDFYSWNHPKEGEISEQSDIVETKDIDKYEVDRSHDDEIIYSMILRGLVGRLGLDVPYIESSPMSREDAGNYPNSGNSHISCWKYALFSCGKEPSKWRGHFENVCSFDSEFCIQGPANVNTIKSFFQKENYWPPNEAWIYHIQRGHANLPHYQQTMFIAGDIFGEINSLEEYVKYGQATHLEQTRAEYESARYDRPNNGGTMSWMFNDCWPTSNWSIIDYYYQPKPAYYAAKRSCKPILPIIFERNKIIRFAIANETLEKQEIKVVYGQQNLSGNILWEKEKEFSLNENITEEFDRISKEELKPSADSYLFIKSVINGKPQDVVTYFVNGWKNIPWQMPEIKIELIKQNQKDDQWITEVKVSSDKYTRICHLSWINAQKKLDDDILPKVWFNDNDFDIPAKDSKIVTITSDHKLKLNELAVSHWLK